MIAVSAPSPIDRRHAGRARVRRMLALVRLFRPLNMVMLVIGVFVGGFLVEGSGAFEGGRLTALLVASAVVVAIAGASNSLNDVLDVKTDRINRPMRPIASGLISTTSGIRLWAAGTLVGLLLAAFLTIAHVLIAVAAAGLMAVYNMHLKRLPIAGNFVVGLLVATAIVFGALALGDAAAAVYAAGFAFLVTLAREVVKDVEDLPGDVAAGARTTAVVMGPRQARRFAAVVIVVTIVLTPAPFVVSDYSGLYLSVVLIANVFLIAALAGVVSGDDVAASVSARLKWAMLSGLVALAFAHALD